MFMKEMTERVMQKPLLEGTYFSVFVKDNKVVFNKWLDVSDSVEIDCKDEYVKTLKDFYNELNEKFKSCSFIISDEVTKKLHSYETAFASQIPDIANDMKIIKTEIIEVLKGMTESEKQ